MKRKFEPYVPVISRFCGSSKHIAELEYLADDEFSPVESCAPSARRARFAQVSPSNLSLLDRKLAKYRESIALSKQTPSQADEGDLTDASHSVISSKTVPEVTAEMPAKSPTAIFHQPLIAMFAALPEAEQRLFVASNPMASIIKSHTRIAEEKFHQEKETTTYLLARVSELQTLLTEAKQVNESKSRDFSMFTKIELRHLMTSPGPAKDVIDELVARGVSEKALERSRGLSDTDMYKLFCEHPDVGEQFEKLCAEALVNYKLLCKDSYTKSLAEVERDNKAWLGSQQEDLFGAAARGADVANAEGLVKKFGPSPAARALQRPMMWATPDVPRDPAEAVERTRDDAEKAKASLEGVKKRKLDLDMDKESVHKRVMRNMPEKY